MANDQFSRIMRFAQRTGDRLIVTDPEGKEPVVIMALDEYEALVEGALGPGDFSMLDGEGDDDELYDADDEYGEAPTLEIVEQMAEEMPTIPVPEPFVPVTEARPRPATVQPVSREEEKKAPEKRDDPSEEQFYLEPL